MESKLFAIYDKKSEAYGGVMTEATTGAGIRRFTDMLRDPQGWVGKYPADYVLHEVGTFDHVTGVMRGLQTGPKVIGSGDQFKEAV